MIEIERLKKVLFSLIFGLEMFLLIFIFLYILKSAEVFGLVILCVLIGVFNALINIEDGQGLKNTFKLNILIIVLIMAVTRIFYFVSSGLWDVFTPVNLIVSFLIYNLMVNSTSVLIYYLKGEEMRL
jgi:hypothetical protein